MEEIKTPSTAVISIVKYHDQNPSRQTNSSSFKVTEVRSLVACPQLQPLHKKSLHSTSPTMRLLTPIVSLSIVLIPAAVALPASPDSTPPSSPSQDIAARSPQNVNSNFFIGSNEETSPQAPVPEPNRWLDYGAPRQIKKNCKGSAICSSTGNACKYAADRFDTSKIYRNYTSYYVTLGAAIKLDSCTAIFVCDNETAYGAGMPGSHIKSAYVVPSPPPLLLCACRTVPLTLLCVLQGSGISGKPITSASAVAPATSKTAAMLPSITARRQIATM